MRRSISGVEATVPPHIDQLKAKASTVSGIFTGVARELILTGLAGGDNKAQAERLMHIKRRLAPSMNWRAMLPTRPTGSKAIARDLRTKFVALLTALSSSEGAAQCSIIAFIRWRM